jgi:hypothetical protein
VALNFLAYKFAIVDTETFHHEALTNGHRRAYSHADHLRNIPKQSACTPPADQHIALRTEA